MTLQYAQECRRLVTLSRYTATGSLVERFLFWTNLPQSISSTRASCCAHPTTDEVTDAIQSLRLNSACGPDRLSVSDLKKVGANALSLLMSCWLEAGRMPEWNKRCRTFLLQKA